MKSPKISVIMPVYNSEKYLEEAIESVLSQSYSNSEFIIIDDGSSDNSLLISQGFARKDNRIIVIENQQNLGVVESLNKGLALARGEFVARMDSDDVSLPMRFEKQVAYLEQHPEVGVVGTAYNLIDENGVVTKEYRPPRTDVKIRWQLLFHSPFANPSVMYRAELGKKLHYISDYAYCEDFEFWTRFLAFSKGANLGGVLLHYRKSSTSVSHVYHQIQQKAADEISQKQINSLFGADFVTMDEVIKLRNWYRCKSVPLANQSDINLFTKWLNIFDTFSKKHSHSGEEIEEISQRFRSVNTYLTTKDQIEKNPLWLSVVVCTYNRAGDLSHLLETLSQQILEDNRYEMIIVDNNSTDETAGVAQAFCQKHNNARYVIEEKQGLANARNRGLKEAKGIFVAYTDDDAELPPNWLAAAAKIIETRGYGAFGGPYYPFYKNEKPVWFKDEYGSSSWLPQEECFLKNKHLVGGNMFFRRDMIDKVGGFPSEYGMSGEGLGYGEETYMQMELLKRTPGLHLFFTPELHIRHLVSEKKLKVLWPYRRYFRQGMDSERRMSSQSHITVSPIRIMLRIIKLILKMSFDFSYKLLFRHKATFPYWQNYIYTRGQYYGFNLGRQWAKLTRKQSKREISEAE
jgi:glycosyltransferase involved in cell wall biosynthesis